MRRFLAAVVAVMSLLPAIARAADNYKIDPVHSDVIYRISHMNVSNQYGRFNDPTGMVVYDKSDPSKCSFTFEVQTAKIDTGNAKRDQDLRGPDYFDAKQLPTITFKSTSVEGSGDEYKVTGDLTLHGVTKSITVPIKKTGEADVSQMKMGYRTGWQAEVDLKRTDYGMNGMVGPVGDDVHLIISFEAVKQ
jgi:polyisoprenoid-binding protein YceI